MSPYFFDDNARCLTTPSNLHPPPVEAPAPSGFRGSDEQTAGAAHIEPQSRPRMAATKAA